MLSSCFRVKGYITVSSRKFCRLLPPCALMAYKDNLKNRVLFQVISKNTKLNERH